MESLFSLVNVMQSEHGYLRDDYEHYRRYCTRKIGRVSKQMKSWKKMAAKAQEVEGVAGKEGKSIKKGVDVRNLEIVYWLAKCERTWSYARQLKTEIEGQTMENNKKHRNMMKKLKKTVLNAGQLQKICLERGFIYTEAVAYDALIKANLFLETDEMNKCFKEYNKAKILLQLLAGVVNNEEIEKIYKDKISEVDYGITYSGRYLAQELGSQQDLQELVQQAVIEANEVKLQQLSITHDATVTVKDFAGKKLKLNEQIEIIVPEGKLHDMLLDLVKTAETSEEAAIERALSLAKSKMIYKKMTVGDNDALVKFLNLTRLSNKKEQLLVALAESLKNGKVKLTYHILYKLSKNNAKIVKLKSDPEEMITEQQKEIEAYMSYYSGLKLLQQARAKSLNKNLFSENVERAITRIKTFQKYLEEQDNAGSSSRIKKQLSLSLDIVKARVDEAEKLLTEIEDMNDNMSVDFQSAASEEDLQDANDSGERQPVLEAPDEDSKKPGWFSGWFKR